MRIAPLMLFLALASCSEEQDNPFDNLGPPPDTTAITPPDPQSFVGLHHFIFAPHCANSGCHDGNFEPDFRTIESAYNTLVLHPVVKNSPSGGYQHRVSPGSIAQSILWLRLTEDIDGQSGIMPLDAFYDPQSQWNSEKQAHLANIRAWIEGGARDMFGNAPGGNLLQPGIKGIYAEADGQPLPQADRIRVPMAAQSVTVYLAVTPGSSPVAQLQDTRVRMSSERLFGFDASMAEYAIETLQVPITRNDFFGQPTEYRHRFTFPTASWPAGQTHYFRAYLRDPALPASTEVPQDGSLPHIKNWFSWHFVN